MVDVVGVAFAVVDAHHLAHDLDEIVGRENAHGDVGLQAETLVDLVTANLAQVVTPEVEEQAVEQRPRVVGVGRVARAQTAVELEERLLGVARRVLVQRGLYVVVVAALVDALEQLQDLFVGALGHRGELGHNARQGAQQRGDRDLALAVNLHRHDVAAAGFEFEPRTAGGDELAHAQLAATRRVFVDGEVHAWRAHQL